MRIRAVAFALLSCAVCAAQRGEIVRRELDVGVYQEYVPEARPHGVLVIVHGTPGRGEDVPALAEKFLKRWTDFADEHRLIAVAPAFDARYGSRGNDLPLGGYRGLVGEEIGADAFVHRIVASYRELVPEFDGRFYLYGHSAGGQFTNRYCVTYPERLEGAVISAAGRFAFPDRDARWPYGMKAVGYEDRRTGKRVRVAPDPDGWERAARLPIRVVVGTKDLDPQPTRAGHRGTTRVGFAEQWVAAMQKVAEEAKKPCGVTLVEVEGAIHSSAQLTATCQAAFAEMLEEAEKQRRRAKRRRR